MNIAIERAVVILIALGANIPSHAGAPEQTLRAALAMLKENGAAIKKISHFYRTPAWPDPADPEFINAVAAIESNLSPGDLMDLMHRTEDAFGRARGVRNAPRTLDLDLIDYDGRVETGPPVLPHPRADSRGFVLIPLTDVAPEWRHPVSGRSAAELVAALPDAERAVIRMRGAPEV